MSQRIELGHGQVQAETKPADLSGPMVKFLIAVRDHGRRARSVLGQKTYAVIGHAAEARGLVEILHPKPYATYFLTEAGRQALEEIAP